MAKAKRIGLWSLATIAAAALALPAQAQVVTTARASDPAGLVSLLDLAGYQPKLVKDDGGDPKIEIDMGGYRGAIFFYGCDEKTNSGCDSLQLQAGFDRKKAWTQAGALDLNRRLRFASVWLDDEGDPIISWDVVTEDGIPAKVFLASVRHFAEMLEKASETVFADE